MPKVNCRTHGQQEAAYVCQHIVQGLIDRKRVGFFWSIEDPDNPHPDAWCIACSERVRATGGEWVGEALAQLEPQTLCGSCYEVAKTFHMGGDPWS